jgi:hypothetical protein
VSFAAITLCAASQRMFIVVVYFVIDSVRELLDTPSYSFQEVSEKSSLAYHKIEFWSSEFVWEREPIERVTPRSENPVEASDLENCVKLEATRTENRCISVFL